MALTKLDKLIWQEKEQEPIEAIKEILKSSFNSSINSYIFEYGYFR